MEQAGRKEGLVLTGTDLGAHQLRTRGQDTGVLLVKVHTSHGCHVIDVVIIPADTNGGDTRAALPCMKQVYYDVYI